MRRRRRRNPSLSTYVVAGLSAAAGGGLVYLLCGARAKAACTPQAATEAFNKRFAGTFQQLPQPIQQELVGVYAQAYTDGCKAAGGG